MKKFFASLAVVTLAGGVLVGAATASSAASMPPCSSYKSTGYGSTLRFVPSSGSSISCYLVQGNYGSGVWALQSALKYCNNKVSSLATDRDFGRLTKNAVTGVQRSKGITPDGDYGTQTRGVMKFYGGFSGANSPICNKA